MINIIKIFLQSGLTNAEEEKRIHTSRSLSRPARGMYIYYNNYLKYFTQF